ncbi:MAG: helix-turn-helix domain-containing protein [Paludibacteraceae bacterium]|nr:helix-turn-helix domain-containing protein [Paludibacteraceae bacterium]
MNQDFFVLNVGSHIEQPGERMRVLSPFIRIYYVRSGCAWLRIGNDEVEMRSGFQYLIPANCEHTFKCDEDLELYYMFVLQHRKNKLIDAYDLPIEVKANQATQLLFENYCNLYPQLQLSLEPKDSVFGHYPTYGSFLQTFRQMSDYERIQLHGMVEIVLSYFLKHAELRVPATDIRIKKVLEYVSKHLQEQINVEQLADYACLTKSYLIRTFREIMHITPLQYVIKSKMQLAQKMLAESDRSVSEIATKLGFSDVSYFIRLFRKNTGFTPQDYRTNLVG